MVFKLRGEDYTSQEIETFKQSYKNSSIFKFINQHKVFLVYGPKGCGKTTFVRMAQDGDNYTYLNYYKLHGLQEIHNPQPTIIIDDIHYMKDDIMAGRITEDEVLDFLASVLAYRNQGHKLIFISEDVIHKSYFKSNRWNSTLFRELWQINISGLDIGCLGGKAIIDSEYYIERNERVMRAFLNGNARDIVQFLNVAGTRFSDVIKYMIEVWSILSEKEQYELLQKLPPNILRDEDRLERIKKNLSNDKLLWCDVCGNPADHAKERLNGTVRFPSYSWEMLNIDTHLECGTCGYVLIHINSEWLLLAKAFFDDVLTATQSYYGELMNTMGLTISDKGLNSKKGGGNRCKQQG